MLPGSNTDEGDRLEAEVEAFHTALAKYADASEVARLAEAIGEVLDGTNNGDRFVALA